MDELEVSKKKEIACDSARPEIIEDLRRRGYNAKGAIKDVKDGIDSVKSSQLFIHKESIDLIKELNNYSWLEKKSKTPIDKHNHAIDALRYAVSYQLANPTKGLYFIK
jgi:phage terminase large subunit